MAELTGVLILLCCCVMLAALTVHVLLWVVTQSARMKHEREWYRVQRPAPPVPPAPPRP